MKAHTWFYSHKHSETWNNRLQKGQIPLESSGLLAVKNRLLKNRDINLHVSYAWTGYMEQAYTRKKNKVIKVKY